MPVRGRDTPDNTTLLGGHYHGKESNWLHQITDSGRQGYSCSARDVYKRQPETFQAMVNNEMEQRRYTGLKARLKEIMEEDMD